MVQQPLTEFEIRCDMAQRYPVFTDTEETQPWFASTWTPRPDWRTRITNFVGQILIGIGQHLVNYSLRTTPALTKTG